MKNMSSKIPYLVLVRKARGENWFFSKRHKKIFLEVFCHTDFIHLTFWLSSSVCKERFQPEIKRHKPSSVVEGGPSAPRRQSDPRAGSWGTPCSRSEPSNWAFEETMHRSAFRRKMENAEFVYFDLYLIQKNRHVETWQYPNVRGNCHSICSE